jgi:hypothetical protein
MTNDELQQVLEEIAVKVNNLAQLNLTIYSTVHEGLRALRDSSANLLQASDNLMDGIRDHEKRLRKIEGQA